MKKLLAIGLVLIVISGICFRQAWTLSKAPAPKSTPQAAVFPRADWTPDELVESYRNQTAPWQRMPLANEWQLYSQDGQDEFRIDFEGWLRINGLRSRPVDCPTLPSLEPLDLVKAYQSGQWNGLKVWSVDYGTQVYVTDNGSLFYTYENTTVADDTGADFLYRGYDAQPWWRSDETTSQFRQAAYDTTYAATGALVKEVLVVDCNVELPDGRLEGLVLDAVLWRRWVLGDGYWQLLATELDYYRAGVLVESWSCEVESEDFYTTVDLVASAKYPYRHVYLYTGTKLLALEDGGRTRTVIDHAVVPYVAYEDGVVGAYYLDSGALKLYYDYLGEVVTKTVVTAGVVDAAGYSAPFIALDDGLCYYIDGWNQDGTAQLVVLGPKTPQEYRVAWRETDVMTSFEEFAEQCRAEWQDP